MHWFMDTFIGASVAAYRQDKVWDINLYIDKRSWLKFINAFKRVFEPLSSQGFYIYKIIIRLDYSDSQMIKLIEIIETLKILNTFKVRTLVIEYWYVPEEIFNILTEHIIFNDWIFRKTLNTKNIEYRTNHNMLLEFRSWKYWECKDDTFTSKKIKDVIDCGFAKFMVDFINIQHFAKYLDELRISNSFGIIKLTIYKEIFHDIDSNSRTDEVLKSLLENLSRLEMLNLNITKQI